jgi:hypothetical protein
MAAIAYSVIATLPDARTADEYVAWLEDGHVDAVVRGGAHSAMIVRIQDPSHPIQVETRYIFSTRDAFDRYVREAAPGLRADGLRLFGPGRGVSMERRVGIVV